MILRPSRLPSRAHAAALGTVIGALALLPFGTAWACLPLAAFVVVSLFVAPFRSSWQFFLPIVTHGPRTVPAVAVTFDDGPDPRTVKALLALLAREDAPATFFVVGRHAADRPDLVRAILTAGHEIGNHSQNHDPFLMLRPLSRVSAEVAACQEVLLRQGVVPLAFRPPVGITNPRLARVLPGHGLTCITFSNRPFDRGNRRLDGLADRVLRGACGGDIIVLHDLLHDPSSLGRWLREVEAVLRGLRARGLRVVPLSTLLGRAVMRRVTPSGEATWDLTPEVPRPPVPWPPAATTGLSARVIGGMTAVVQIAYPLLTLAVGTALGPRAAAAALLVVVLPGLLRMAFRPAERSPLSLGLGAGMVALLLAAVFVGSAGFILAYPSFVNAVFLLQFASTLVHGPPFVERLARLQVSDLTRAESRYCRSVTLAWCGFFILNGSLATALAVLAPRPWWAIYTGVISYILVGVVFSVEYLVRKARFGRYGRGPVDGVLAAIFKNREAA